MTATLSPFAAAERSAHFVKSVMPTDPVQNLAVSMALAGLATTHRGRLRGLAIGLGAGTWMGVYQMLKGAHYLSHTLITALLMWLLFLGCRALLQRLWPSGTGLPSAGRPAG